MILISTSQQWNVCINPVGQLPSWKTSFYTHTVYSKEETIKELGHSMEALQGSPEMIAAGANINVTVTSIYDR